MADLNLQIMKLIQKYGKVPQEYQELLVNPEGLNHEQQAQHEAEVKRLITKLQKENSTMKIDCGFTLELKQQDSYDANSIFYRYRYKNFLIWFTQCQQTGNIYMVYVNREESAKQPYDVYSRCDEKFYPTKFELSFSGCRVDTAEDCETIIEVAKEGQDLLRKLYLFFATSEHAELWRKLRQRG